MKLIDKAALIAEIEKLKGQLLRGACSSQISMETSCKEEAYNEVLSFLNALEVKEVDLEKEVDKWYQNKASKEFENVFYDDIEECAKHFFELGLKAKGE